MTDQSVTLTLPEAARIAGISESSARELARQGHFPGAFRLPGSRRWIVHRQVLLDTLQTLAQGGRLASDAPDSLLLRSLRDLRTSA